VVTRVASCFKDTEEEQEPTVEARVKFIEFDARRDPKTDWHCCCCQKDLKPGHRLRHVYLTNQMEAVHPADLPARTPEPGDLGWHLLGMDCARKLGLEWSTDDHVIPADDITRRQRPLPSMTNEEAVKARSTLLTCMTGDEGHGGLPPSEEPGALEPSAPKPR
jgi:hypothetical protein